MSNLLLSELTLDIKYILLFTFMLIFVVWYIQYHWKRRRLYRLGRQNPGPKPLPFIGNGLYFVGSTADILNNILWIAKNYESPTPLWLGNKLCFILSSPKHINGIFNSPNALQKDELFKFAEPALGTGLFTASGPKWKQRRKIILPTFNQTILNGFVETFSVQSEHLAQHLEKKVGTGTFDIYDDLARCTFDIICETAMGTSSQAQKSNSDFIFWASSFLNIFIMRVYNIWLHFDFIFYRSRIGKEFLDITEKMQLFTDNVIHERKQEYYKSMIDIEKNPESSIQEVSGRGKSFLHQLIHLSEEGANLTDRDLREEVLTFLIAGSDTTASVSGFIFVMLGMFPEIQQKVYYETISVLGQDRSVEPKDLNKLVYTEMVIKETMRLFPIGPIIIRAVTKDIELDKFTIPAGSPAILVVLHMHRDPKIWSNPLKFDPDRFSSTNITKQHLYSYVPFSKGPRNCAGMKFAYMAMKSLIATVIRKYEFSTEYKSVEEIRLQADLIMKPVDGFKVSIKLRV